jgi:hypothetical protein
MCELASARGVRTSFAASMPTCRNRRLRQQAQQADVACFGPLASGGCDRRCRHAGPRLEKRVSRPPDTKPTCRVRRITRCPTSVISYKQCLVLKKLKKSAIKKKFALSTVLFEIICTSSSLKRGLSCRSRTNPCAVVCDPSQHSTGRGSAGEAVSVGPACRSHQL